VQQLNTGFARLNPEIEQTFTNQAVIIWSITLIATISVVTGVKVGIRRLSEINFLMGQFIMLIMLFQEDTWCAPRMLGTMEIAATLAEAFQFSPLQAHNMHAYMTV
jgi:choline-glycine betaine transporter